MLDTVRADRLTPYGYERDTTPHLDALARRGVLFEEAQSSASWTVPSVASVFTGLFPSEHGAIIEGAGPMAEIENPTYYGFSDELPTLPVRLGELGYRGYARIANPLVGLPCFARGFDAAGGFVTDRGKAGHAKAVVDAALERLDAVGDEPFFFYLHFMDAHHPLEPPRSILEAFLSEGNTLEGSRQAETWGPYKKAGELEEEAFQSYRLAKRDLYDASLYFMDAQIGRLFAALEERGILEDTLVVVTADHGEEFWDHPHLQRECYDTTIKDYVGCCHGHSMFQELLRVPLIFAGPGVEAGERIEERVRVLDLGATILELVEGPRGPERAGLGESVSLVPLMRGGEPPVQQFLSESITRGNELKAIIDGEGYKLIRAVHEDEKDLLFALERDPLERENLLDSHAERAESLRRVLELRVEGMAGRQKRGAAAGSDQEEQLKSLGYVGDD